MSCNNYTFGKTVYLDFETAIDAVTQGLARLGFGVLTDIDVAATMKKKLNLDMQPYRILGACNPAFAHEAISTNPSIGALLPCNVIVRQSNDDDGVYIEFMDPESVLGIVDDPEITTIGKEVKARLMKIMSAL